MSPNGEPIDKIKSSLFGLDLQIDLRFDQKERQETSSLVKLVIIESLCIIAMICSSFEAVHKLLDPSC